ncbi:MAG: serine/threonine-protein phosphatase [Pyrinomonadaceae bacterium]|nr:serine/threonine-protein phosphatase [Pyrinomonadaceae bacterium]
MTQGNTIVSFASISDKGLSEKRPQNEDSYLVLEDSGLFAVADGVGGAQAGDVASEMAVEILGEAFINLGEDGDVEDRMREAFEKANAAVYQMSRDLPQLSTMATTLVAIHVSGNIASIGHVGDSRLYRLDSAGLLFQETQDHSVVEEEVRAGRMTREQAETHPSRNVISRAIGAEESVEIDMKTIMFETNSRFLLCSDGVTRHIPDDELRDLLFLESDNDAVCRIIKEKCFERGAEDNLTAVVIKVASADASQDPRHETREIEEETVATARAGATSGQTFTEPAAPESPVLNNPDSGFELDDIEGLEDFDQSTAEGKNDEVETISDITVDDDSDDIDDAGDISIPTRDDIEDSSQQAETVSDRQEVSSDLSAVKDVRSYRVDENMGGGFIGKLVSGLAWLLVGVLLGVLGFFLYSTQFAVPAENPAQAANQALLTYEQQRRIVDADPATYIAAHSTAELKTAGENYLVGRAYLIQGNYGAAKTSFEKALEKLDAEDVSNRAVLKNDISTGMTIVSSEDAQKTFESSNGEKSDDADSEEPKG